MLRERRSDFSMLEVTGAGLAALVILVILVKTSVALNYLSTRGECEKIVSAFRGIEA